MNANISSADSRVKACGLLILIGAAVCSISLFTLVRYAIKGDSPYSFALLIRNLACIAGYITIGIGIFTDKHHLFRVGLFTAAVAFVIDSYFPLMWIDSNRKYYGSLSAGLSGGNFTLLLCYLTALIGFILMGLLFSKKPEDQFSKEGSIAMICIVAYIVLAVCYAIYYMKDNYLSLWEYASSYIPAASLLSMIGAVGVLLMPIAFSDEIPRVEIIGSLNAGQKKPEQKQNGVSGSRDLKNEKEDTVTLLIKYKELLDMGIITDEEFQLKKSELLK